MARRAHIRIPVVGRALSPIGSDFVSVEVLGGVVLLAATFAALVWSNTWGESYDHVWSHGLTIGSRSFGVSADLRHWVNDGLMTIFFFVVGLEIKRELVCGELRDRRKASLPIVAALGGMVVPALLFVAVNTGSAGDRGWAIPMATDIAFAVVVLAALGSRVPKALKLFLLTLAIVDDIGAIVVIAVFYSTGIAFNWLFGAVAMVAVVALMRRCSATHPIMYIVPALVLWVCTFESGVHATIAGVALGLLTPARPFAGTDVIQVLERRLHPWSSLVVIPIFAIANAGIRLDTSSIGTACTSRIAWGIVVGLVVGKPLGIMLATTFGVKLRVGRLPEGVTFRHLLGAGCVAGIGFTVSLFVADLSFAGAVLTDAKVGIVAGSVVSAVLGGTLLFRTRRPTAIS